MANWPSDVETVNVVWGGERSPAGNTVASTLTVTLIAPGTDNIHRTVDHTVMIPLKDRASALAGEGGSMPLPVTNQSGWVDASGAAYTGWAYKAELRYGPVTNRATLTRTFSPVMGQGIIYLEELEAITPGSPVQTVTPAVTSVNGMTGAVIIDGSGDVIVHPGTEYQFANSALWSIAHGLGHRPIVSVQDSTGENVEADVSSTTTTTTITFPAPFTGSATLI